MSTPVTAPVVYSEDCRDCPRLAAFLDEVKASHPSYFCRPVAPFGDARPRLLIVGLAPGMHGANASGRPFTGDYAGILLYDTLHRFGYGSKSTSISRDDDLRLTGCQITNAVKCLPPENKPLPLEVKTCNQYLAAELAELPSKTAVLALGKIAHDAVLRGIGLKASALTFGHGAEHSLPGDRRLFDSYHCSRYNTQTRRLTEEMFHDVFRAIAAYLGR